MKATELILVRHGETRYNRERKFQGQTDVPLTPKGRRQAWQIADSLSAKSIQRLYSSPLRRAMETAEFISRRFSLPIRLAPGLAEIHQGRLEGLTLREVQQHFYHWLVRWRENPEFLSTPGGESFQHLRKRVLSSLWQILRPHKGNTICLVSHTVPICIIRQYLTHAPASPVWSFEIPPGTYVELSFLL